MRWFRNRARVAVFSRVKEETEKKFLELRKSVEKGSSREYVLRGSWRFLEETWCVTTK